jgi:hypothetical protein
MSLEKLSIAALDSMTGIFYILRGCDRYDGPVALCGPRLGMQAPRCGNLPGIGRFRTYS